MGRKLRVLLCTINCGITVPLSILYLKSVLAADKILKKKVRVEWLEFYQNAGKIKILWQIERFRPDIIGFSCYTWNFLSILSLVKNIKRMHPGVRVVLGGPEVTPVSEEIMENDGNIDFIVRGEGEMTFRDLVREIALKRQDYASIAGLTFREKGKIIKNPDREPIKDLDLLPSPYMGFHDFEENREYPIEGQRGCAFKCSFCGYDKSFDKVRFFGIKKYKKELGSLLRQKKVKRIYLMDPVFNFDLIRAKDILRFIIRNNANGVKFHTEMRAELVDEELARLMGKANFELIEVGLQSTNRSVLENINRITDFKRFKRGFELMRRNGLPFELQLIYGLPGDNYESVTRSIREVIKLDPPKMNLFTLQVFPGTYIWRHAKELGIFYDHVGSHGFLKSRDFSIEDSVKFEELREAIFKLKCFHAVNQLRKDTGTGLFDLAQKWIRMCKDGSIFPDSRKKKNASKRLARLIMSIVDRKKLDRKFYKALVAQELLKPEK